MPREFQPVVEVAKTSGTALKVYAVLTDRALQLGRTRYRVRLRTIAKRLGYSQVRGVSRALSILVKAHWITRRVKTFRKGETFTSCLTISLPRLRKQLSEMDMICIRRGAKISQAKREQAESESVIDEILRERGYPRPFRS